MGASKLLLLNSWQASVMAAGGGPDKGLLSNRSTEDPEAWQDRNLAAQPHIKAAFSKALGRECLTQSGLIDEGAPAEALRQAQRGLLVQMRRRWCNCGEDRQSFIATLKCLIKTHQVQNQNSQIKTCIRFLAVLAL